MAIIKKLLVWTIVLSGCISCGNRELNVALSASGDNRPELEKVLHHYKDSTLKLQAAEFLITHMIGFNAPDSSLLAVYQPFCAACEPLKVYKKDNPDHAMFRIRQISRGENDREVLERPFVYKNGEVIWL
jgi:hypothetical protein